MKTNMGKVLGLSVLTALFTAGCASSDDAAGAPPTVIIERESSPAPVIIEKDKDRDVEVDVNLDKD